AGYPDLETTTALLNEFERRGVRVCELGIPFSDPIADGPVIQASYTEALSKGLRLADIFEAVRRYRAAGGELALVAMLSYSIVFRRGAEKFLADAAGAGFDGLIVPDLPLEEAGAFEPLAAKAGLANVMLVAPNTPPDRRVEIARHSRGFLYFISVAGITGERTRLPESTLQAVAELRKHTATPVCIGFGVSSPETVAHVCEVADGAIVGSAIVHRITDAVRANAGREKLVAETGEFVSQLLAPLNPRA
ncbi:MAG TPA: tryptophan synthase subunit alpha, partial [Phycisphaerae bacterium]|nr:tryptophan synthase subunit alpha [Phycisphaerae bacterium]